MLAREGLARSALALALSLIQVPRLGEWGVFFFFFVCSPFSPPFPLLGFLC